MDDQRADSAALQGLVPETMSSWTCMSRENASWMGWRSIIWFSWSWRGLGGVEMARRLRERDIAGV